MGLLSRIAVLAILCSTEIRDSWCGHSAPNLRSIRRTLIDERPHPRVTSFTKSPHHIRSGLSLTIPATSTALGGAGGTRWRFCECLLARLLSSGWENSSLRTKKLTIADVWFQ
jgi:hypothetical protein